MLSTMPVSVIGEAESRSQDLSLLAVGGPSTVTRVILRLSKEVRQSPAVRPLFC